MKLVKTQLLFIFLMVSGLFVGCSRSAGWLVACDGHISKDQSKADTFQKELTAWLSTNGFTLTGTPGEILAWSGAQYETMWYRGSYKKSPAFLLQVQIVHREHGFTEFHFAHEWQVHGSQAYVENARTLSDEFTNVIAQWLKDTEDHSAPCTVAKSG